MDTGRAHGTAPEPRYTNRAWARACDTRDEFKLCPRIGVRWRLTTAPLTRILPRRLKTGPTRESYVANSKQAAKRARQAEHSRQRNASQRSMTRTFIRKVRTAIEAGDKEQAAAAFKEAQSHMDRAGRKGLVHRNAMSRQKSRLDAMIKAMA